jgi:hypothetical protein
MVSCTETLLTPSVASAVTVTPLLSVCPWATTFPVMIPVGLLPVEAVEEGTLCIGIGQLAVTRDKVKHAIRTNNVWKIDFGFIFIPFSL